MPSSILLPLASQIQTPSAWVITRGAAFGMEGLVIGEGMEVMRGVVRDEFGDIEVLWHGRSSVISKIAGLGAQPNSSRWK